VRKVDPNGNVTTIASPGLIDPTAVAVDRAGNVYVSDTSEQCVFVIRPGGTPQRFAGTCVMGQMGFTRCYDSGPGTVGPGVFGGPSGLVADSDAQVVYIADAIYETIRVAPFGRRELATLAGGYGLMGARDGVCGQNFCCGTSANVMGCTAMQGTSFRKPVDVTLAADRSLLIADRGNCAVRRIASPGTATTCRSSTVFGGDCVGGLRSLNGPLAVTEGVNGLLFVSDTGNRRVVKLRDRIELRLVVAAGDAELPLHQLDAQLLRLDRRALARLQVRHQLFESCVLRRLRGLQRRAARGHELLQRRQGLLGFVRAQLPGGGSRHVGLQGWRDIKEMQRASKTCVRVRLLSRSLERRAVARVLR